MSFPIYLDNNATTQTDPTVLEAMLPYFSTFYGNAASHSHAFGWQAAEAVEQARQQVAALIGADPPEIVWTSGATESDNLALKGVAEMYAERGDHLVTVATEHPAILDAAKHLEGQGKRVTYLGVDRHGLIDVGELESSLTDRTLLVSVMLANNETGTIQSLSQVSELCRARGVLLHTDATQAVGKIAVDVNALGVDLLSLSAHKMHGPKGVGALYVRRKNPRVRVTPQIDGGGHERGFRSGTLNVPGIVGLGAAARLCHAHSDNDDTQMRRLRDRLHAGIADALPDVSLNGHPTERLPNTLNLSFGGIESEALLANLSDIAVSAGSACSSACLAPSHVLKAMGMTDRAAHSALRFSLSRHTTADEIERVIDRVAQAARRLRDLTPSLVNC